MSCDKITPELPLAPLSEPDEMALETAFMSQAPVFFISSTAEKMVMHILIPVSPSGTGKTLRELIHSFFASRLAAPAQNIRASSFESIVFISKCISS